MMMEGLGGGRRKELKEGRSRHTRIGEGGNNDGDGDGKERKGEHADEWRMRERKVTGNTKNYKKEYKSRINKWKKNKRNKNNKGKNIDKKIQNKNQKGKNKEI